MTARDVVFLCVGLIATAGALLAVTTRHVVHAALWLVLTLGSLAGCYIVLGNELVALVQLLIYVGAVVVLVVFALMLTRAPIGPHPDLSTSKLQRAFAAIAGAGLAGLIMATFIPLAQEYGKGTPLEPTTYDIASSMFSVWVWPFELLSVLLLVALIGSFALSRVIGATPEARIRRPRIPAGQDKPLFPKSSPSVADAPAHAPAPATAGTTSAADAEVAAR